MIVERNARFIFQDLLDSLINHAIRLFSAIENDFIYLFVDSPQTYLFIQTYDEGEKEQLNLDRKKTFYMYLF